MESYDVIVIGGGAAGAAAAVAAARSDASVLLVRRGPGATALAHGGWSTAPPQPFRDALRNAGLEIVDCASAVPHADGMLVRCAVAAASHARAAAVCAAGPTASRTIVCGIAGLPSFRPVALSALWRDEAGLPDDTLVPVTLTLPDTPAGGWSPVSLAAALENEPRRLGASLARAAHEHDAAHAILPAVLGLDGHATVLAAIDEAAGVITAEALASAPSVPGWRLDRALLGVLADAGVRVVRGNVTRSMRRNMKMDEITVSGDDHRVHTFGARAFVLATGKFLGGGITAGSEFEEPALGCDVAIERFTRTIDDPSAALVLTDPARTEPQPVLSTGVRVDADARPLNEVGTVYAWNVFVAGTVRAGVETNMLGLGAAAFEGWTAGERAAVFAATPAG